MAVPPVLSEVALQRLQIEIKEAELSAEERQFAAVLSHVEREEVTAETRELFQRFVKGELSAKELDAGLAEYDRRNQSGA